MGREIVFKSVSKSFGSESALNNISFKIKEGEFVSLLGTSGCGKTTILRLINGLIKPESGEITVGTDNVTNMTEQELVTFRRSTGYVIQNIGLMPHWDVERNIATKFELSKNVNGFSHSRVLKLMDLVNLPHGFLKKYPRQMSGGQQQRVGVARALANNPDVVLMDEPFGALDNITRTELQDELLRIKSSTNCTFVFVTHDIDEAFKLSDKIILMSKGKIEQIGTPNDLVTNPSNKFVKNFLKRQVKTNSLDSYGSEVISINKNAWRVNADNLMTNKGISKLVLVDDSGKLCGMITKKSLSKYVEDMNLKMESLMDASIHDYKTIEFTKSSVTDLKKLIESNKGRSVIIVTKHEKPYRLINLDQQKEVIHG